MRLCCVNEAHWTFFFFLFPPFFFSSSHHALPGGDLEWGGDKVLEACCLRLTSNQSGVQSFRLPTWLLHTRKYHDRGNLPKIEFLYLRFVFLRILTMKPCALRVARHPICATIKQRSVHIPAIFKEPRAERLSVRVQTTAAAGSSSSATTIATADDRTFRHTDVVSMLQACWHKGAPSFVGCERRTDGCNRLCAVVL